MTRIFVDTSAWISLVAAKDPHHAAVADEWRKQAGRGTGFVTSSDVVAETITFLRYRAGHATAVDFRRLIGRAVGEGRLILPWVDEELFESGWRIFVKYTDHELSMTDCTSFALCRRERIKTTLSLDRHFLADGMAILPGP